MKEVKKRTKDIKSIQVASENFIFHDSLETEAIAYISTLEMNKRQTIRLPEIAT